MEQICKVCRKSMYVLTACPKRNNAQVCYYCCKKCKDSEALEHGAVKCLRKIIGKN